MKIGQEEEQLRKAHHRRIRWVKRLLRPLPRRTNIHRYPGLGWIAGFLRKRMFLWSFRTSAVVPAIWAGSILAFLPVYGIQLPLACGLALLMRANLPIFVGLQLLTNPVTFLPVYFVCFQFGHLALKLLGVETEQISISELKAVFEAFEHGDWATNVRYFGTVFGVTALGGTIMGTFVATLLSSFYRVAAMRATRTYERIRELQQQREARHVDPKPPKVHLEKRFFKKGPRWR